MGRVVHPENFTRNDLLPESKLSEWVIPSCILSRSNQGEKENFRKTKFENDTYSECLQLQKSNEIGDKRCHQSSRVIASVLQVAGKTGAGRGGGIQQQGRGTMVSSTVAENVALSSLHARSHHSDIGVHTPNPFVEQPANKWVGANSLLSSYIALQEFFLMGT